jgi:S1-C subfamily serine protease
VVSELDGQGIDSAAAFFERLGNATNGQELTLSIHRDGDERRVRVRAEEVPGNHVRELLDELTGMQLEAREGGGYVVSRVRNGSGAQRIGVQPGDLLLGINGRPLEGDPSLRRQVLALRGQSRAFILVQRGAGRYHVAIPLP